MKKLIEELEVLKRVSRPLLSEWGEGYTSGVMDALRIVKSHNPWIDASELPPRDEKADDCSINVWVTDGERRNIGFYDFAEEVWIFGKAYGSVTHWAYLPELPK